MPKSPKNKENKNSDEPVTQFFNFPEPWVKDYDPAIHGYRPPSHFQGPGPTNPPPIPTYPMAQSQPEGQAQPGQNSRYSYNPNPGPVSANSRVAPSLPQNQWNINGVYGGPGKPAKSGFPRWGWLLVGFVALVILIVIVSLLKIYFGF